MRPGAPAPWTRRVPSPLRTRQPYPARVLSDGAARVVRQAVANDPVTAAYLAAAMRMIERHLGPGAERVPVDPEDENSLARPLFGFLSQRAVAAEVAGNPVPFPQVGNVSTLRSTWRSRRISSPTCCASACGRSTSPRTATPPAPSTSSRTCRTAPTS
ncbi:hypothetical protein Skr01_26290 [Sphaerisporangium krabiense]|uniref:Uncharacterized protein n=1 Tax=Sphaerisporangium krabiense TaxID=763782 RepID=A0A7W9DT76_9ACTN|nr:hypothetical protein [Sphaerisporangium krabiense]GII62544.1 hypothetical protein Skr01_26290 [Sphaerisporangium krabiense]